MPTRENAPITKLIVGINSAVHFFLYGIVLFATEPAEKISDIYQTFGLVPHDFWEGRVWQPLTSMFLHGFVDQAGHAMARGDIVNAVVLLFSMGLLHIGVNMIGVWSLGGIIERTIGSARYAWLYFVSGLFGALLVLVFNRAETNATIGASGALLGLLGALAIFFPNARVLLFFVVPVRARSVAIGIGVISLVLIFWDTSTPISHPGHLGGLLGGILYSRFALGLQMSGRDKQIPEPAAGSSRRGRGNKSRQEEEMLDALNQFFTSPSTKPKPTVKNEASEHPSGSHSSHTSKATAADAGPTSVTGSSSDFGSQERPIVPPSAGYPVSQGYPDSAGFPESGSGSELSSVPQQATGEEKANFESSPLEDFPAPESSEGSDGPRKKLQFDPKTGRFDFE